MFLAVLNDASPLTYVGACFRSTDSNSRPFAPSPVTGHSLKARMRT
jgi:hypothetical protein